MEQVHEAIYGQIVRAHDGAGNELVIKQMNRHAMGEQRALRTGLPVRENGFQEMEIANLLQKHPHPNVVRILRTRIMRHECHIVMPYYSNKELYDHVAEARLSNAQLLQIFRDVVHGLDYIHSLNIAHLDLSLENVLLDHKCRACICDFGMAELNGAACAGGRGKPLYMAPEMYTMSTFNGFQCDMWSLGVILFTMFTGCPPVDQAKNEDQRFRVLKHRGVEYLIQVWGLKVPPTVIQLLKKLLVADPSRRMKMCQLRAHPLIIEHENTPSWLATNIPCHVCLKTIGRGHRKWKCCGLIFCAACSTAHECDTSS